MLQIAISGRGACDAADNQKEEQSKQVQALWTRRLMKLQERRLPYVWWILRSGCWYDGVFFLDEDFISEQKAMDDSEYSSGVMVSWGLDVGMLAAMVVRLWRSSRQEANDGILFVKCESCWGKLAKHTTGIRK